MANINTELEQIRKAVYGREVRGSIANAIELINKEQINTNTAQTNLDGKFNQLIINAGNSNAEVVAARVKADGTQFDTLSKRLDKGDEVHNILNNEVIRARTDSKKVVHKNLKARLDNFDSQFDSIETKKANQSALNNLKNQVNTLVIESGGNSNAEVVQSRVSHGFTHKNLDNRLLNIESIINTGKFNVEFFDLVNRTVSSATGELSESLETRITTNSKYNISALNEIYLRINKLTDKKIIFYRYFYNENEELISNSLVTSIKSETDTYYESKMNVTNAYYMRLVFKFENDEKISENDIYENINLYFYNDDRVSNIYNEFNQMCYDNLGNKFNSPSELIKDISKIVAHNKNIFNKLSDENVNGYINSAAGGIDNSSTYKTSYFVKELQENEKYIITPRIRKFLAYDKNGKPIPSTYVDANTTNYVFTVDSSWSAIRFTYYVSDEDKIMLAKGDQVQPYVDYGYEFGKNLSFNDFQIKEIKNIINDADNKLANKILFNFGDSIAAGDGNNGKGYAELFATKHNMICHDFAVGGATLGETSSNNITTQVSTAISKGITPDYILIEGGTNDIAGYNVPIGTMTNDYNVNSFDKTTSAGALEWIIYTLKTKYPNAKIAFVSVHKMGSRDYAKQVERQGMCCNVCKKWSTPVIDIFNRGTLNTFLPEHHKFTNPTQAQPNGDRTHPNDVGYTTFYLQLIYETLYFI
jgi:lysophospholipase L1-like esterase|nr:MAG TPA: GDSL like Lipase Acylhydrolase [Caudoviricetes sp.]